MKIVVLAGPGIKIGGQLMHDTGSQSVDMRFIILVANIFFLLVLHQQFEQIFTRGHYHKLNSSFHIYISKNIFTIPNRKHILNLTIRGGRVVSK